MSELSKNLSASMQKTVDTFVKESGAIRTGRANSSILDLVKVDYYGFPTPLLEISQVSTPEPRVILIKPYEKEALPMIEKAILASNIGLNPSNDGNFIRLNIPALTEERRKEFIKLLGKLAEEAKVAIRNIRRTYNDNAKKNAPSEDQRKRDETEIQKVTDEFIKKIEQLQSAKEKEIMTI
jgi:ribosome recycling factor